MASSHGNEPPDVTSLLKNLSKTEITLISELLRNKASKQLQDGVSEVGKIVGSLINSKNGMSECDTIYWYCNIKLLSSALQSAEQQALGKLKSIKKNFDCTTCKKKVELNYRKGLAVTLQKHVCNASKSPGMSGSDQIKLMSPQEYELNEILCYANKIKEKLFFKVPKSNLYLYTIYVIDDVILCLVCGCEIPGRTNVMQHISGSKHIKGLQQDYSIVLAFHKYFGKLKEKYQVLQRGFRIYDNTSVQCVLCSHVIRLQDVKQHMEGPCFVIDEDGKYVIPVKYDEHIKATIYKDLLDYCIIVDNVNCPTLQNIGNGIYCLLCNANVTKHIYIHIDSSAHQAHLENKATLDCLKKYHQVWTALPVHIQVEQTYFRRREGKITCIVCSTYFPYNVDDLASHVNSMNHKMFLIKMKNTDDPWSSFQKQSSQSVSSRSTSVETDRTTSLSTSSSSSNIVNKLGANSASIPDVVTPPVPNSPIYTNVSASLGIAKIPYDQSVLEELYPDGLMLFTITMDTVKYPIIIKRETAKHCFICNADVTTSLLLHANSPEHIQQMGSDRRRELLKKFHDLWISLPQSDQCRQIAFKIDDDLVCMLCDKRMPYDIGELKSHIESWEHVQKVMAKHFNGILNDRKQVPNFSQTLSNGIVPNSPVISASNTVGDNRVDMPIEKPKSLQDLLRSIKNSNNVEGNKSPEKKAESSLTKSGAVTYSKEVLNDLYGEELIHYYIRIDGTRYPFIQNMGTYKRCLICNIDLISSVLFHINSSPHIQSVSDPEKVKQLRRYHDLWLNFSESDQREQKHFEIGDKLKCSLCQKELEYDVEALTAHVFSTGHGNETWSLNNGKSTVSGKLIDESNLSEIENSSDDEGLEAEPVEGQTLDSNKSKETSAVLEVGSNSVGQQMNGDINNHIDPPSTWEICDNIYVLEHFNKSYCLLCEKHITPGHLTTKKHLKKLDRTTNVNSVIHKRVETFLRKWDEVASAYQHMKNEFLPASPTLTFCLKCAVNVEFSMLEKHLSQFHGEVLYDLPEKLSLNFKSPTTRYPQKIVDKYFKENIPQCNIITDSVAYPIFQNTVAGLCCLVCRVSVLVDVFTHLSSQSHLNHLINTTKKRKQKVIKYHDFWAGLPSKYQEQIYYFNNAATSAFLCLICGVSCGKKKMATHFESSEHISNLFQQDNVKASASRNDKSNFVEDVPKEPIDKKRDLFKGSDVQELLFPRKINDFVRKLHCLDVDIIQAPTNDKFFCFLCQTETNDVIKHTALPQHELKLLDHSTNVEPVRVFHEEWGKIVQKNKRFQASFFPVTSSITFCKICCLNVEYKQLDNHLKMCHDELVYTEFQDRLDDDFKFISKKEYSPKVQRTLYKDNISQCNLILEGISYPIIQTVDNHLRCLLCQKEISDDKYSHLNSINHALSAINLGMKKRLKMYHDTWLDGDEHFQMQQIYFEKDRDYYCKVCVLDVKMGDLQEHITSSLHTTSLQKFLINERSLDKSNIFHDIEILPQIDKSKMNESLQVSQLDGYYNSDSESEEGSDDGPKQYSKSVISECYPDFDKYNCAVDGIPYPIFRNTIIGTVCMLCKRNPKVESINEHIAKDSHKSKMIDESRHNNLRNFHKAWMKQEPAVQNHQKYFHRMQCLPCAIQVDYDSIADHVLNSKHERKIKLPFNTTAKERHEGEDYLGAASSTSTPIKTKKVNSEGVAPPSGASYKSEKANQSPKFENNRKTRHNIKKSIQNPNSQNIADRIPLRYGKEAKFLIVENTNIFCGICSKKLKNDMRGVKEHLDSAAHLTKSNISKKKIKYSCDICNKYYSTEASWDNHLVDLTHMARYNNLTKSKKGLAEYECLTCNFVIFGDETAVQKHRALFMNRRAKEIVLPKPVLYLISSRSFIQDNSEKLLKEANKAFHSQDKEKQVCVALVKVLKEYYPECKAYPFGSRLTGLGYCDSDLDVFLDIGDMYNGNHHQDAEEQANIVNIVARTLQKHKSSFSDINKVAGARTPIVQVFHKDSNIDCDISFKHGLSVENTTFIKLCLDLQTVLTPTLLYLKEWYASTNLSGLSSYALTMLMIFYLQTTGYLLSVKDLRLINSDKGQIIDGWETIKYTVSLRKMKEYVNSCDYTVIQLLENFFEYYAKFDFEKWVVCPLMGYLMSKSNFNGNGVNLPAEMANYVQKLRTSPNPEYFRNLTPMCVQDPFDLSHNLTKAFPRDMLKKFQAYCSLSKKHISALN